MVRCARTGKSCEFMKPSSPKPQAKTLAKKRKILERALSCFSQHGVENTTIDMICQATDTSVGSLYHHFGNKEAIAAAVFIEGMRDFSTLVMEYLSKIEPKELSPQQQAEQGIKALVYANVDWISEHPTWAQFVFHHRGMVSKGGAGDTLKTDISAFYRKLTQLMGPLIEQGVVKQLPVQVYGSFISGPVHDYARHYLAGRYPQPLTDFRETFAEGAWQALKN